ncbi:MAG: hypothetical protein A2758_02755 [Candidatus Zambryskibacteria bacterium RIFCSPHIGHO2_01_FULL_49_18]|uniref:Lipoprotein n=2 Tax=Candidatus Zambryskiibacteriota TaxID=1817925 RepID=A0A1G2T281_9BACT|nr:MAG: hypothetical protein A2758_02755 [Candidatus Zambryskibacteria bacterium RIFCSPHIGHO2_01_FULL_49_18]OHB04995.1 MAG: hypothetical protein A3A26_00250 [Candidatus Zambryskibacteria bacterium RIFCSPLOWO2_01_FULL_47_14]
MRTCVILALIAFLFTACGEEVRPIEAKKSEPTSAPVAPEQAPEPYYSKEAKEAIATYHISPELDKIPNIRSWRIKGGWREVVSISLYYFVSEPQTYNEKEELNDSEYGDIPEVRRRARNHTRRVMIAYGIFQTGNNPIRQEYLTRAVTFLWKNDSREMAYRLTVPSIKRALAAMPRQDRNDYLRILRHTSTYMATFDLKREVQYLTSLRDENCTSAEWQKKYYSNLPKWVEPGKGYYGCEHLFTILGPDGKSNPYRKAETFVYRRVAQGWKLAEMKQVLDRLIADLS